MLSRVANGLYWMRRYVERADHNARVIGVNLDLVFDRAPADVVHLWGRLLEALLPGPAWSAPSLETPGGVLADLTNIEAVAACVAAARENARQVRQHITAEMWDRLNGLHLALQDPARRAEWAERPHGYFQAVRDGAALFDAAIENGLARDEAWHFLRLGLFLERASGTARLLACQLREAGAPTGSDGTLDRHLEWTCLLDACDALELYRRRCGMELVPARVTRFLIADGAAPRSLRYAFDQLAGTLAALSALIPGPPPIVSDRTLGAALGAGPAIEADPLALVTAVEAECDRLHRAVHDAYIDHRARTAPVATREVS